MLQMYSPGHKYHDWYMACDNNGTMGLWEKYSQSNWIVLPQDGPKEQGAWFTAEGEGSSASLHVVATVYNDNYLHGKPNSLTDTTYYQCVATWHEWGTKPNE